MQKTIAIKSNKISIQEPITETKKTSTRAPKKAKKDNRDSFEQQFGMRLPIWIGGIALILAGFFMIKYSIESNLISPTVRVSLGVIFGVSMLYIANFIRDKPKISNGPRIAQSLSGAGIADLYICIFAATNLYDIIPSFIGFIGMAIITVIAVFLSLKHGSPIALMSLIGGLLTPAMMNSNNPSAAMLLLYLYIIISGLLWVIRKNNWWKTALLAIIGAFS